MRTAAVALLLLLAACGGGASEEPAPKTSTKKTTPKTATESTPTPSQKPTTATPTGVPAPEALSGFRCAQNAKGLWNASGFLANTGKTRATYQVTVHIGEAAGGDERAKTVQLPNVAAGGSVEFTLRKVPAPDDGGPCHVQVLATR